MKVDAHRRFAEIKSGDALPSPQGVALTIAQLALRDDVGSNELTRIVKTDPAMAGRLLRYANAAHGGSIRHIVSLNQAVTFLGLYRIRQLALAFSLVDVYRSGGCEGFDYPHYWSQSLATGVAAQELCGLAQAPPEDSFTCGLLSGIGHLGFASVYPIEYAALLQRSLRDAELRQAEIETFGITHADLAAEMLVDWGLPQFFANAVRYHEAPDDGPYAAGSRAENMARMLHLSSRIACMLAGDANLRHEDEGQMLYHAAARIGLEASELAPTVERIRTAWIEWAKELNLPMQERSVADLLQEPPSRGERIGLIVMPMRVALISDDATLVHTLSSWLRNLGQTVQTLEDGATASVRAYAADVMLVDVRRCAAGDAMLRELRLAEAPHRSFLIVMLNAGDEARVAALLRAGADDYLLLPPSEVALEARLHPAQRVVALQGVVRMEREASIRHSSEWARNNRRLLHEALTDALTQLPNRRYGMDHLTHECAFSAETKLPIACIMLDIDHFKRVNDTYGHEAGDDVLRQFAATVQANCRKNDVVFRYGGEEFCVVCPSTGAADAMGLAERILDAVRAANFKIRGDSLRITASAGAALRRCGADTADLLIAAADRALYRAKESGRDRVVCGEP